jgi:hypothetical protein
MIQRFISMMIEGVESMTQYDSTDVQQQVCTSSVWQIVASLNNSFNALMNVCFTISMFL